MNLRYPHSAPSGGEGQETARETQPCLGRTGLRASPPAGRLTATRQQPGATRGPALADRSGAGRGGWPLTSCPPCPENIPTPGSPDHIPGSTETRGSTVNFGGG
jgi:hypothetical protein